MFTLSSLGIFVASFFLTGEGEVHLPKQAQITLKKSGPSFSVRGRCLHQAFY